MTIEELQELTGQEFKFVALDKDDNIKFAVPIPGVDAWQFSTEEQIQDFIWDPEETEACEEAWDAYIQRLRADQGYQVPLTGKRNRTRKQAENAGAITNMPLVLAIPTIRLFQYSISIVQDGAAHLQPIMPCVADNLRFDNGTLYFQGMDASRIDLVQYYDKQPLAVSKLDLPILRALYSVILQDAENTAKTQSEIIAQIDDPQYLNHSVKIYLPVFLEMMGYGRNCSKDTTDAVVATIMSFHNIIGIIQEELGGRKYTSHYPVMLLTAHNDVDNTIQFSSPYINKLVATIYQQSVQKDKRGNPKLKRNGEPFMLPSHSYLIKSSIAKEKNKRAVEIVCIIVTLIEQAGNCTPNIKVQTIVDRCPELKNAIDAAKGADKNKLLKRAFTKAWELLPKQTLLKEKYKDIELPSPTDPQNIPTMSSLNYTFKFPHKGKIKDVERTE